MTGGVLKNWTFDRVRRFFAHVEDLVDEDLRTLRERARTFEPAAGLDRVAHFEAGNPSAPELPERVLGRLAPFFESGLLLERVNQAWRVRDLFWKGNTFHLEQSDRPLADALVRQSVPLQVDRAPADKVLGEVGMSFLAPARSSMAYLIKPSPEFAYVLVSDFGEAFARDHVGHAHRLITGSFLF